MKAILTALVLGTAIVYTARKLAHTSRKGKAAPGHPQTARKPIPAYSR